LLARCNYFWYALRATGATEIDYTANAVVTDHRLPGNSAERLLCTQQQAAVVALAAWSQRRDASLTIAGPLYTGRIYRCTQNVDDRGAW